MEMVKKQKIFNFAGVMVLVCIMTAAGILLTACMKKRTKQCVEWMGYLVGLRDFIENAELDRMKVLGEQYPNLFYHIFPYAYVFGLSEIYADKLEKLNVEMPVWFGNAEGDYIFRAQYMKDFHQDFNTSISIDSSSGSGGGSVLQEASQEAVSEAAEAEAGEGEVYIDFSPLHSYNNLT